ncbi:MAG: hypothetical protein QME62_10080 [Armatimonadota bacterium]|nr:hypothetical protein [Armatimonadota bacterium]
MESGNQEEQYKIRSEGFNWRACIIVPIAAVLAILILTVVASVFGPPPNVNDRSPQTSHAVLERRQAFIEFGQKFFEIALKADQVNENAFAELGKLSRGEGDLSRIQRAFLDASVANKNASSEYKAIVIPNVLVSKNLIRKAANTMSDAYAARSRTCDIVVLWTSSPSNKDIARDYSYQVARINELTMESLRMLAAAAEDNGLTTADLRQFLPRD